jgi:hypothetical protein
MAEFPFPLALSKTSPPDFVSDVTTTADATFWKHVTSGPSQFVAEGLKLPLVNESDYGSMAECGMLSVRPYSVTRVTEDDLDDMEEKEPLPPKLLDFFLRWIS